MELLRSACRRDSSRVRELLHPDFVEIGRSGRRWTRDEIVAALADEDNRDTPTTDEWRFIELAPDLAVVTYVIHGTPGSSLHSSIWSANEGRLEMRFHQGTFISDS